MNRAEFDVAIRVNFERKEGESELVAYTRAFDAAMRQIGKSAADIDAFHKLAADVEAGKASLSELSAENVELLRIWREMSQEAANKDLLGLWAHQEIQKEIDATRAAYEQLQKSGKLTEAELAQQGRVGNLLPTLTKIRMKPRGRRSIAPSRKRL